MHNKYNEFLKILHEEHSDILEVYVSEFFKVGLKTYLDNCNGWESMELNSIMNIPILVGTFADADYQIIIKEKI